jgi:hypothetical protein
MIETILTGIPSDAQKEGEAPQFTRPLPALQYSKVDFSELIKLNIIYFRNMRR